MSSIRTLGLRAAVVAGLALAALGAAPLAQARSDVVFSVSAQVAPGIHARVSNAPLVYYPPQPVHVLPAPVYYQPAPVYYQPAPVYYRPVPVQLVAPVRPGWRHGHGHGYGYGHWRHNHHHSQHPHR